MKENEMTKMTEMNDYVSTEELEAIDAEEQCPSDYDELEEFAVLEEFIDYSVSLDDMVDSFNQFDEERDLDFYES